MPASNQLGSALFRSAVIYVPNFFIGVTQFSTELLAIGNNPHFVPSIGAR